MLTNSSILQNVERHRYLHKISRNPNDLAIHDERIQFELEYGHTEALLGSLLDYWIASSGENQQEATHYLAQASSLLSQDWLLLLYDGLYETITSATPIPESQWSVLTEDVLGQFDYFVSPTEFQEDYLL